MPAPLGYAIVIGVLLLVVALALRSLWRGRSQGVCSGDCSSCGHCSGPRKH